MNIITSELLSSYNEVVHGFVYDFDELHIEKFAAEQSLKRICHLKQVHSDRIVSIDENFTDDGNLDEGDALVIRNNRIGVSVFTADCVPIIIFERESGYVSAIHAGWRGTLSKIALKAVNEIKLRSKRNSYDFIAAIGPAIGICCYEVGTEVAEPFINEFGDSNSSIRETGSGKYHIDLVNLNTKLLSIAGISKIDTLGICTKCNASFPSYRRDGVSAKRMLSFIGRL